MTTDDPREARESAAAAARDTALRSLIANLVSMGLTVGFMVAIAKRDSLARGWLRVRRGWSRRGAAAMAEDRAVAEFGPELSSIEKEGWRS